MTTREAAKAIGVGVSTLQNWAARGIVKPTWRTPGGQARWDVNDLQMQLHIIADESKPQTGWESAPVAVAIVTSKRGVLVGRRADNEPPWTFIAGELEPGEDPADAAVREVKEETGLEVQAGDYIGTRTHPATGRLLLYMAAQPVGRTGIHVGDRAELLEVRWVGLAEARRLMPDMFAPVADWLSRTLEAA